MKCERIIVISDLHVGAGELDDFDPDVEVLFAEFLSEIGKEGISTELVINGDFLEFVQANPWEEKDLRARSEDNLPLCFTKEQSLSKLESIIASHPTVFYSLGEFLSENKQHKITVLPGNHDVDLFWEEVRDRIKCIIASKSGTDNINRLTFHMERVYCPPSAPNVWVEHGHQFDKCNSFFIDEKEFWSSEAPPIFMDKKGNGRLFECIGVIVKSGV